LCAGEPLMVQAPFETSPGAILTLEEVEDGFPSGSWQRRSAARTLEAVASTTEPFPCVFAAQAAMKGALRFSFPDPGRPETLAVALGDFLAQAREIGPLSALLCAFPPDQAQIEDYRARFWAVLRALRNLDPDPWPATVPRDLQDPAWSFCFAGEPVFPLCTSPAHQNRRTRQSETFMISFQPRWIFDHHLPSAAVAEKYSRLIQGRMRGYDKIGVSPDLGQYGEGFLDARKYFFLDENAPAPFPASLDEGAALPR
jgi:FPC/CPF motif-containing protein YcgG